MNLPFAICALSLYAPIAAAILLWILRPHPRRTGAATLLALLWTLPTLLILQRLNQHFAWWTFHTQGPTLRGLPIELDLGWACLWSALPVLAFRRAVHAFTAMLALDLLIMPLCAPVVTLGPAWLIGEATAALTVLLPALLIAQWTREHTHLNLRATAQVLIAAGIFLYLPPELVFAVKGGAWHWTPGMQLLLILAIPGLSAVQEFAERGHGTPIPYDPPHTLVTSGLYRFVANPMQLACTLVLLLWGLLHHSLWIASAALLCVAYSAGLARWDERQDLDDRFGAPWQTYRNNVKDWLPNLRPYAAQPARLYIAQTCGPCSQLQRWLEARHPHGLQIHPAELHPARLKRMRYEDDAYQADGVQALARALEHLNLAWALLGAGMRLPILRVLLQGIADAIGFGERDLAGESVCSPCNQHRIRKRRPAGWFSALG